MPEGPDLHLASLFINSICKSRLFAGKVRKNPIHKCADAEWDDPCYTISSVSRGKELKVFLQSDREEDKKSKANVKNATIGRKVAGKSLQILFNFGMSGKFEFTSTSELPKHAHLSFYTRSEPSMALSFVDPRRFGKWQVGADWAANRGPCVLFEYPLFRANVLSNLQDSAFNKPLCEVLLNQKYFNGIGNYLRAEIIYRAGLRPFEHSRSVFASLPDVPAEVKVKIEDDVKAVTQVKVKSETPDILELCNLVPLEVVGLGMTLHEPEDKHFRSSKFFQWVQCFFKPGMNTIPDHNKRTMWYHGDPGPLVPKEGEGGGAKKQSGVYTKKQSKTPKKSKPELCEDVGSGESEVDKLTDKTPSKSRGRKSNVYNTETSRKTNGKEQRKDLVQGVNSEKGRRAMGGKAIKRKAQNGAESSQEKHSREPEVKKSQSRKNAASKESIHPKSSDTESKGQKCR